MLQKNQRNQRYVYVVLSRTYTIPARWIRFFTGKPYSHTSLALDMELKKLYSFGRKGLHNPFNNGFIIEHLESGIFGMDKNITCCVYAVPVTEEQYEIICHEIDYFVENKDSFRYNNIGLVSVLFGKNIDDGRHFFCSQFVSHIFYRSGIKLFSKADGLIRPYDFHLRLKDNRIYKGKLSEYRDFLEEHQGDAVSYLQEEYAEAM